MSLLGTCSPSHRLSLLSWTHSSMGRRFVRYDSGLTSEAQTELTPSPPPQPTAQTRARLASDSTTSSNST